MASTTPTDGAGGPQAPPGKKLCPHTCSCIVKYSSKERGRSALSTRGAAYWDHIKNTNIHPDCSHLCPGHSLLRANNNVAIHDSKEPPVKKQKMYGSEMEVDWNYTGGWQSSTSANTNSESREGGRDLEGLLMDTKTDINRWISGGSRPFVYTAAPDTIPTPLKSYAAFIEAYGSELGLVLHFQRVPTPRNPLSSPSSSSSTPSAASTPVVISTPDPAPSSSDPTSVPASQTADNSLLALSNTALYEAPSDDASATSIVPTTSTPASIPTSPITPIPITTPITPSPISPPVTVPAAPPSPPGSPPPSSPAHSGSSWVFVKALEQRWDVKTWAEWYSKECSKKKHKNAYYLVNISVRSEDHATFKKDPVTAMLSHRGTLCLNQYINFFDDMLPIPDMDAKLYLAPPWTGAVLTPPAIDRNRTQSLHRVIFGDGINLVHIWEKLTEDQEHRFRKIVGLPNTHDRQLHPFQLKYNVDDSVEVWDRAKEEELGKWGILSNRIELMSGQTLIVPLDMPHVMKKLGPLSPSSSHSNSHTASNSSSSSSAPTPFSPVVTGNPPQAPLTHGALVTPTVPLANPPTSPSPIVVPASYNQIPTHPDFVPYSNYNNSTTPQQAPFTTFTSPTFSTSNFSASTPSYANSTSGPLPAQPYPASQQNNTTFNATSNLGFNGTNYTPVYNATASTPTTFPTATYASPYTNTPIVNNFPNNSSTTSSTNSSPYFLGQPLVSAAQSYPSNTTVPAAARNSPYKPNPSYTAPSPYSASNYTTYGSPTKASSSITPIHSKNPSAFPLSPFTAQAKPPSPVVITQPILLTTYSPQHSPSHKEQEEKKVEENKDEPAPLVDLSTAHINNITNIINNIQTSLMEVDKQQPSEERPTKEDTQQSAHDTFELQPQAHINPMDQPDAQTANGVVPPIALQGTDDLQVSTGAPQTAEVPQVQVEGQAEQQTSNFQNQVVDKLPHENGQGAPSESKELKILSEETPAEAKPKPHTFPIPLLTYSGDCSFVGTTRESFARNVDLMKYWHKQLRKDHQPVIVHVDLAIFCLISYVVATPSVLQDNHMLIEHFIGAIPHFKEFVAEEGERVSRFLAKYTNTIHTMLKKESRQEWTCRKCKCQLTNFMIRFGGKNETSCIECLEDDDESSKKKKKVEKTKKAAPGEAVFRFGTVESLVLLANKAMKLVNKLNSG